MVIKEEKRKLSTGSITNIIRLKSMLVDFQNLSGVSVIIELVHKNQILQFNKVNEVIEYIKSNNIIHIFKLTFFDSDNQTVSILSTSADRNEWIIEYFKCEKEDYDLVESIILKYFLKGSKSIVRKKLEIMIPMYLSLVISSILMLILIFNSNSLTYPLGTIVGYGFIVYVYSQYYEWYISKLSKSSIYIDKKEVDKETKKLSILLNFWKSLDIGYKLTIISTVFTIVSIIVTVIALIRI